jgi:hypothetical protein
VKAVIRYSLLVKPVIRYWLLVKPVIRYWLLGKSRRSGCERSELPDKSNCGAKRPPYSMFDVERSMFEVQVVVFGVHAVKVLLTVFSLQSKQPDLLSAATTVFDVRCSAFDVQRSGS